MPSRIPRPLAVDIGASKLEYCAIGQKNQARAGRIEISRQITSHELLSLICSLAQKHKATSMGIGFPGYVQNGRILELPNLPLVRPFDAKKILEKKLRIPVSVENDVKCMALAIWHSRGMKSGDDFIVIAPGSGIGGAIVKNGSLIRGPDNLAGEFGHMKIILPNGKKEEWEKICGGFGIARRFGQAAASGAKTSLDKSKRDARHILHSSDALAQKISINAARQFGFGLALIASSCQPKEILIAGPVGSVYMGALMQETARSFKEHASKEARAIPVRLCALRHPALTGAALLACHKP